jgi:hypothetical protein
MKKNGLESAFGIKKKHMHLKKSKSKIIDFWAEKWLSPLKIRQF